jgi:4-hydroxy-2-oxoheptanedioate aldolase
MTSRPFLEQPELHTKAPNRAAVLSFAGNLQGLLRQSVSDPTKTLWGVGHNISSPKVTKAIVDGRPDYLWIDLEHGSWTKETIAE